MIRTVERSTNAARSPAVALPALGAVVRPAPAPVLRLGRLSGLGTGRAGRAFRSPAAGDLHGRLNGGLRLARFTRCLGASSSRRWSYRSASSGSSRSLALGENRSLKGKAQPPSAGWKLPVPRLKDILVLTGPGKAELDGEGIPRPEEGGVPREPGANTATVGHRPGFPETKLPYAFYELDETGAPDRRGRRSRQGAHPQGLSTCRPCPEKDTGSATAYRARA